MWNIEKPIKELPKEVRKLYVWRADELFEELEENRLVVYLEDAPNPHFSGHKIRVVKNRNPKWYRELYHNHAHFRRDLSIKSLDRIRQEKDGLFRISLYKYDKIYRNLITHNLLEGYKEYGEFFPPNKTFLSFLKGGWFDMNYFW